jgi:hypothetical protein
VAPRQTLELRLFSIRGRVLLDVNVALLYRDTTRRLYGVCNRNWQRLPERFVFKLRDAEFTNLRSQFAISSFQPTDSTSQIENWSQTATSSGGHCTRAYTRAKCEDNACS